MNIPARISREGVRVWWEDFKQFNQPEQLNQLNQSEQPRSNSMPKDKAKNVLEDEDEGVRVGESSAEEEGGGGYWKEQEA